MIDAFRLINPNMMVLGQEPRQTTSVLGHLQKPSIQALIHGLNRHYYSISINYRKNELEQRMLMNLNKKSWVDGLTLMDYNEHCNLNKVSFVQIFKGIQSPWSSNQVPIGVRNDNQQHIARLVLAYILLSCKNM